MQECSKLKEGRYGSTIQCSKQWGASESRHTEYTSSASVVSPIDYHCINLVALANLHASSNTDHQRKGEDDKVGFNGEFRIDGRSWLWE